MASATRPGARFPPHESVGEDFGFLRCHVFHVMSDDVGLMLHVAHGANTSSCPGWATDAGTGAMCGEGVAPGKVPNQELVAMLEDEGNAAALRATVSPVAARAHFAR